MIQVLIGIVFLLTERANDIEKSKTDFGISHSNNVLFVSI